MLVAEVQTPSDTTFRVYDFNRVDPTTNKLRTLHVEQAMQCIEFSGETGAAGEDLSGGFAPGNPSRLVDCDYFTITKVSRRQGDSNTIDYSEPVVLIMLEGEAEVSVSDFGEPTRFKKGETILLPASMKDPVLSTLINSVWLEVSFPMER